MLAGHQRSRVVYALPDHQVLIRLAVVSHGRVLGAIGDVPVWPHVADAEVIGAGAAAGRGQPLAVDFELLVGHVVAVPHHQVLVIGAVVGHVREVGSVARAPIRPHVADAKVVVAHAAAGRGQPLAKDLLLAGHQRSRVVYALPDHQVLIRRVIVGHGRVVGAIGDAPVWPHVADAKVGAGVAAGRGQSLAVDLVLLVHQGTGVVVAVPHHQVLVIRAVVGHVRGVGGVARAPIRPHVADAKVVGAHAAAGGSDQLAKDLGLVVSRCGVVASPDHQVLVARTVVGHRRGVGVIVCVPHTAHAAEAKVVRAHLSPRRRVQALGKDLVLVIHQRAGVVVALPDHQVLVVVAVVSHGRTDGVIVGIAVWPHVADAKVVIAHAAARGGQPLAKDLELLVHQGGGVVVTLPDHQVLVVGAIVGHGRVVGVIAGVARPAHVADAKARAEQGPSGRVHALAIDLVLVVGQGARVVIGVPDHQVLVVVAVVGHGRVVGIVPGVLAHEADAKVIGADLWVNRHRVDGLGQRGSVYHDAGLGRGHGHRRRQVAAGGIVDAHAPQANCASSIAPEPALCRLLECARARHHPGDHQVHTVECERLWDEELLLDGVFPGQVLLHQATARVGHGLRRLAHRPHRVGHDPGQWSVVGGHGGQAPGPFDPARPGRELHPVGRKGRRVARVAKLPSIGYRFPIIRGGDGCPIRRQESSSRPVKSTRRRRPGGAFQDREWASERTE